MIAISMTDFVDFVISSGSPKLTKVKQVKGRGEYSPATDFWKPLRDAVIEFHQEGSQKKSKLDLILTKADPKKLDRYQDCIRGYKRFLGRRNVQWFTPAIGMFSLPNIEIRVNPELGLEINGDEQVVKLYFKAEPLSKRKVDILHVLMHKALKQKYASGITFSVLDVPRGKAYATEMPDLTLLPLLYMTT